MTRDDAVAAEFRRDWARFHPACFPLGWMLRGRTGSPWVRFHALPGSKRYADDQAQRDVILSRAYALDDRLLGVDQCCWVVEAETGDFFCTARGSAVRGRDRRSRRTRMELSCPSREVAGGDVRCRVDFDCRRSATACNLDEMRRRRGVRALRWRLRPVSDLVGDSEPLESGMARLAFRSFRRSLTAPSKRPLVGVYAPTTFRRPASLAPYVRKWWKADVSPNWSGCRQLRSARQQ